MNAIIGRFSALSGSFGNPPAWPGPLATTWRPQGTLELWAGPSFCPAQHVSLPPRAPAAPRVATRRRSPETHPFISPLHDPSMVRTAVSTAAPDCTAAPIALRLRLHCGSDCTAAPIALRLRLHCGSDRSRTPTEVPVTEVPVAVSQRPCLLQRRRLADWHGGALVLIPTTRRHHGSPRRHRARLRKGNGALAPPHQRRPHHLRKFETRMS
jgi:hypothetical protein